MPPLRQVIKLAKLFNELLKGEFWVSELPPLLSGFSRARLCATPQTAAHQDPPSLGFSRQEHWSGLPLPSPGLVRDQANSG